MLHIYNTRSKWIGKEEYPNLRNYSLIVARNMMCNHIKYVNAKKRTFENISVYNKNSVFLDADYDDNEDGDKSNYIEKFCFDNDLFNDSPETDFIIREKEFAQDELLQKCVEYLIDWQNKKKDGTKEQRSLSILMDIFSGMDVLDIVRKYNLPDDITSSQYVQHTFYRYKRRFKELCQDDYNKMMLNYGNVEAFNRDEALKNV